MKKNQTGKTEIESNPPKLSKKTSGSDSPGSSARQNKMNENSNKGNYSFQKEESDDTNKLAPREEL